MNHRSLESLSLFLENRPLLKARVDEVLKLIGISNYSDVDPIIKNVNFYGGNDAYDDDGKNTNHFDKELQRIIVFVTLQDDTNFCSVITQSKVNLAIRCRVLYKLDGCDGQVVSKKIISSLIKHKKDVVDSGKNPFEGEYNNKYLVFSSTKQAYEKIKVEYDIVKEMKEQLPMSFYYLNEKLKVARLEVIEAEKAKEEIKKKMEHYEKHEKRERKVS